jgi:hypothetical protein
VAASYDAEILARQLGELGRDLQDEITELGRLEEAAVDAEAQYRRLQDEHEDAIASAFLAASGSNAEARKAEARLACQESRAAADRAWKDWSLLRGQLRTQQASLQAMHRRVEIGRSLLSREKALISLGE